VTWSIVVHSVARPRTMGSKRLLISVPNATKDITAALNALLADAFALFIKTRNIRWPVSGQRFRDYHLLFEK
jgi:DNA-binding ferritin-like protein